MHLLQLSETRAHLPKLPGAPKTLCARYCHRDRHPRHCHKGCGSSFGNPRQQGDQSKGRGERGFLDRSTGKDTPRSANLFSVLEKCMVESTKDMLDSKVPSETEEVVSNPPTLQPDDPPYILMCSMMLRRSTHIPLTIHTDIPLTVTSQW